MLRIHFTSADLARVRVASEPDIAWEMSASLQLLQNREGRIVFDGWRGHVRDTMTATATRQATQILATLLPHSIYFPDFLTPAQHTGTIDAMLDAVLSTDQHRVMAELALLDQTQTTPAWVRRFGEGDKDIVTRVSASIRQYCDSVLTPIWPAVRSRILAYNRELARATLAGGVDALFAALGPSVRWTSPILEADYPCDVDLHLDGRGLTIVASFFTWRLPVTLCDPALPPVLVIPIEHQPGDEFYRSAGGSETRLPLAELLGRTRARLLELCDSDITGAELARHLHISGATTSHHTSVLRECGLVGVRRDGVHNVYFVTDLGRELLGSGGSDSLRSELPLPRRPRKPFD